MSRNLVAAGRWNRKIAVTFRDGGWPKDPCDAYYPGLKLCCTQNIALCDAPAVWKVERKGSGYTTTGYYCDLHLSDEDRRPA
jgi:hypothetical protein